MTTMKSSHVLRFVTLALALSGCGGSTGPGPEMVALGARRGHAMAYDEARRQLLLFGGFGPEGTLAPADRNSTWSWTGSTWTRFSGSGPSARHEAVMTYDASRQRVVLFGGRSGVFPNETVLTDTWEWDGQSWTRRAESGPSPRVHMSLAYDRRRQRVVLFGGFNISAQQELRDIWEWNGSAWASQPVSTAANSLARGAAYDERTQSLLLFAAIDTTMQMFAWNGSALAQLTTAAPWCQLTIASLGAARGLVNAGWCERALAFQTAMWNGTVWTGRPGTQPSPRIGHALAYHRDRDIVVLFGGETMPNGGPLSDTWEYDGTTWARR